MRTDLWLWSLPVLVLAGVLAAFWVCDQVIQSFTSRTRNDDGSEQAKTRRRGVTGAAFALQEVFDPGIAHVIQARQDVQAEEADPAGDDDDDEILSEEDIFKSLMESLVSASIDGEEIRRLLTDADLNGHDWHALYEKAVATVRAEQPYLTPRLPPPGRVAPR